MSTPRRYSAALITFFLFAAPIGAWTVSTGDPLHYFRYDTPPGQFAYVLSRLLALAALSLFWFQAMAALARGLPQLHGFFRMSPSLHRRIGLVLFGLVVGHGLLFFLAASLRTGHIAYGVLIPSFDSGYYKLYVSLGVIALALFPLGIAAGFLRRSRPGLRWLHRIWAVVFLLMLLHGLAIGTETRFGVMLYVYLLMVVSLAAAAVLRVWNWRRQVSAAVDDAPRDEQDMPVEGGGRA